MITEDGTHNDGSPLGNGAINSTAYAGLGICPYKECLSFEKYWKCYQECFKSCVTYLKRKNNSKLVKKTQESF